MAATIISIFFIRLSLDELYTTILGTTCLCLVVGNGFVRALTYSTKIETIDTKSF